MKKEEYKNVFIKCRKERGLSREAADDILDGISSERLERIENEKTIPTPEDINIMAKGYNEPMLQNYYCANYCEIGKKTKVVELENKDLFQITVETLAELNSIYEQRDKLLQIVADGKIENNEMDTFLKIKEQLEKMGATIENLKIWFEQNYPGVEDKQ